MARCPTFTLFVMQLPMWQLPTMRATAAEPRAAASRVPVVVGSVSEMSIPAHPVSGTMRAMHRIAVIGPVASGKSTLARHLGSRLGLTVVDLDDVYFGADRSLSDDEWAAIHRRLLEPERWIIAGDYRGVAGERFAAADTIIWLDLPRLICSWRALRRPYPASKVACFRWIWRYPTRRRKQTIASLSEQAGAATVFHLRNPREVRGFMTRIRGGASEARASLDASLPTSRALFSTLLGTPSGVITAVVDEHDLDRLRRVVDQVDGGGGRHVEHAEGSAHWILQAASRNQQCCARAPLA